MESAEKNIFLKKNQYFFVIDGCAVAKYLIPQRPSIIISFKSDSTILIVCSFGLTSVLYCHLILWGLHAKRKTVTG